MDICFVWCCVLFFFFFFVFVFFFKQKTAYEIVMWLEFRRCSSDLCSLYLLLSEFKHVLTNRTFQGRVYCMARPSSRKIHWCMNANSLSYSKPYRFGVVLPGEMVSQKRLNATKQPVCHLPTLNHRWSPYWEESPPTHPWYLPLLGIPSLGLWSWWIGKMEVFTTLF